MPFGVLWSCAFFLAASVLFAVGIRALPPGFRSAEVFLTVLLLALVVGLVMRERWARWAGVGLGALYAFDRLGWLAFRGAVLDWVLFLGACLTVVLLLVPATGDVARGLPAEARRRSRAGNVAGLVAAFALVGFMTTYTLAFTRFATDQARQRANAVEWSEFAPGLERARSEGKPVLVDFFAEWCGPCKVMDQRTFRDPNVVRALDKVVPVRIDAEGTEPVHGYRGEDLANLYGVVTYPTLVLMDASGREIARSRGAKPPDGFLAWLQGALARAEAARRDPTDPDRVM